MPDTPWRPTPPPCHGAPASSSGGCTWTTRTVPPVTAGQPAHTGSACDGAPDGARAAALGPRRAPAAALGVDRRAGVARPGPALERGRALPRAGGRRGGAPPPEAAGDRAPHPGPGDDARAAPAAAARARGARLRGGLPQIAGGRYLHHVRQRGAGHPAARALRQPAGSVSRVHG